MFNYEEYEKLANSSLEEAKKYCELYKDDIFARAELISLDIIAFHERSLIENYNLLQKCVGLLKKNKNKMGYLRAISNLVFYGFELDDLVNVRKNAIETLKYLPDYLDIKVILANANVRMDIDVESSFKFLKDNFNNEDLNNEIRVVALTTIGEYFYKKEMFDEGRKFFEKCFLFVNDKILLRRELLNMSLGELNNLDKLKEDYDKYIELIDEEEKFMLSCHIIERLLNVNSLKEVETYLDIAESINDERKKSNDFILLKARVYGAKNKLIQSFEEINKLDRNYLENDAYALYIKAITIFLLDDRRMFDEGIELLIKASMISNNEDIYIRLMNAYCFTGRIQELEDNLKILKRSNEYYYYLSLVCSKKGDWSKAERLMIKYMYREKRRVSSYIYIAKKSNAITKAIYQDFLNGTSIDDYRTKANMYLHGFGSIENPNPIAAKEIMEQNIKEENYDNCCYSLIGNTYLTLGEPEKAFNYFKKGHNRYINYLGSCCCSTGFYCYCKAFGLGTTQNEDEAYNILKELNPNLISDVGLYTYVHLCIKKNINLEEAWDRLNNFHERRYDPGKYFMMIKLAKALGIKTKKYEKLFTEALKHVSVSERLHYLENPELFYLTNI